MTGDKIPAPAPGWPAQSLHQLRSSLQPTGFVGEWEDRAPGRNQVGAWQTSIPPGDAQLPGTRHGCTYKPHTGRTVPHVTYLTRLFQPLPTPQQGCWNTAFVFLRRGFICKDLHISSRGVQFELQGITRGTVLTRGLVTTGTNTRCECCKNNFSRIQPLWKLFRNKRTLLTKLISNPLDFAYPKCCV